MNLPKQSRPVMRDMSGAPIRARVGGLQPPDALRLCLQWCKIMCPYAGRHSACEMGCYGGLGPRCP
jgi:hypothetical protein